MRASAVYPKCLIYVGIFGSKLLGHYHFFVLVVVGQLVERYSVDLCRKHFYRTRKNIIVSILFSKSSNVPQLLVREHMMKTSSTGLLVHPVQACQPVLNLPEGVSIMPYLSTVRSG
jgi:hypothetical protein